MLFIAIFLSASCDVDMDRLGCPVIILSYSMIRLNRGSVGVPHELARLW